MKKLLIVNCQLLESSLPKAAALEYLSLWEYDMNISRSGANGSLLDQLVLTEACVQCLCFAHSLRDLSITGGHSIMPFSLNLFPDLRDLRRLTHCAKLVTFPEGGISAPKLCIFGN
ncbi:hypothetical protein L6164_017888 [Bauhinia variegata]|uniref:Uncharacterized protein n=1 Tax=Bauhinia variegata TaxID=167791 RepID=A0ACB9NCV6_BAUVA|nr:hypothetical protein L6164_017888 [Bauhinia variegata]